MAVKGSLKGLIDKLQTKSQAMETGSFLARIAPLINTSIQTRVQDQGLGIRGKMAAYKNRYATYRQAKGRQNKYRDLTFTGKMWGSLSVERLGANIRLFFSGAEDAKKAALNQKRNKFFGLAQSEKDIIKSELKRFSKI